MKVKNELKRQRPNQSAENSQMQPRGLQHSQKKNDYFRQVSCVIKIVDLDKQWNRGTLTFVRTNPNVGK